MCHEQHPEPVQRQSTHRSTSRYTGFIEYDGEICEEIDVDAADSIAARALILDELKRNYEPGGKLVRVEQRFGLYM